MGGWSQTQWDQPTQLKRNQLEWRQQTLFNRGYQGHGQWVSRTEFNRGQTSRTQRRYLTQFTRGRSSQTRGYIVAHFGRGQIHWNRPTQLGIGGAIQTHLSEARSSQIPRNRRNPSSLDPSTLPFISGSIMSGMSQPYRDPFLEPFEPTTYIRGLGTVLIHIYANNK